MPTPETMGWTTSEVMGWIVFMLAALIFLEGTLAFLLADHEACKPEQEEEEDDT